MITQGPWSIDDGELRNRDQCVSVDPPDAESNDGKVIALCYGAEREANAKAIAAIPMMVEAMGRAIKAIKPLEKQGEDRVWRAAVRARVLLEDALKMAGVDL